MWHRVWHVRVVGPILVSQELPDCGRHALESCRLRVEVEGIAEMWIDAASLV